MITFHPAARPVAAGFAPMITLRGSGGRMVGSRTQANNVFDTKADAVAHALIIALRAAMLRPDCLTVCRS